jgi:hypothetical protein
MTKTFAQLNRIANPGLTVMLPLSTIADSAFVWNFEFGLLGFV